MNSIEQPSSAVSTAKQKVPLIAFYLPQFHPIPENDEWWGRGFTEWRNVAKAKPLFSGHYQPHLPADLSFYDLRLPEVREAQAAMASHYGVSGFCYYHYWFGGKRLLERPFNEVLESGKPNFPFCLCWANENWTRIWDGSQRQILCEQIYSEHDDRAHIRWLARALLDPRYIRVDGKPLLAVYRARRMPNPERTAVIWREESLKLGVGEILLCTVESAPSEHGNPRAIGFDAAIEFQPEWDSGGDALRKNTIWRVVNRLRLAPSATTYRQNRILDYRTLVDRMLRKPEPTYRRFPCVNPSWDNAARRKTGATILRNSTPEVYEKWLRTNVQRCLSRSSTEQLIFVNAWNEWAEGNHLEPCRKWGHAYLEATQRALNAGATNEIEPQ